MKTDDEGLADVNFTPHGSVFSLLSTAIRIGDMPKAEKFFNHLLKVYQFTQPHVFNSMVEGFAAAGNPKKALEIFKKMLFIDVKPNRLSLLLIIKALAP